MPNVIRQSITRTAISVTGSNGVTVTLTAAEIVAHYDTETGNATTRRLATIAWAKQQLANGIGVTVLSDAEIDIDFDGTRAPTKLVTGEWQSLT